MARLVTGGRFASKLCNLFISNVPGPQQTLYMNGARLLHTYGMAPLADGMGLCPKCQHDLVEGREAFEPPAAAASAGLPVHHLYVCPRDGLGLANHLAVRDYLRAHPDTARRYGELKKETAAAVLAFAALPGRDALLGQLVGGLKSPLQKLHAALSCPMRDLAAVLKQVADNKA